MIIYIAVEGRKLGDNMKKTGENREAQRLAGLKTITPLSRK
jgi:hypothetical protein